MKTKTNEQIKERKKVIVTYSNSWDSGASLIDLKGNILFSANEERFTREKLTSDHPKNVLEEISRIIKENNYEVIKTIKAGIINYSHKSKKLNELYYKKNSIFTRLPGVTLALETIRQITMLKRRIIPKKISEIDHHQCHAAGAYYTSGFKEAIVITIDAYGDGKAATVSIGKGNSIKLLESYGWQSTPAHLYSRITQYLGYKSHRHEGKITGLAAYGKPTCYEEMKKLVSIDEKGVIKSKAFLRAGFNEQKLKKIFGKYKKEDVACSLQKVTEEITEKFVRQWVLKTGINNICLAGGLFANVRLNQVLHEIPEVNNIYIFPHMGDGGLSLGAGLAEVKPTPKEIKDVYFGPGYSDKEILQAIKELGIKYTKPKSIEKEVARLLAEGKVVARFDGRMEYGPRALGNRSILYKTNDKTVNEWLNKKLKRTEFMPFAPATIWEDREEYYKNLKGAENAARFMTITFNCTEKMKKENPGVVHLDGTARPQLVKKENNPSYYKIIEEYKKITGISCIINTSFNMHEEPIVMTPKEAIKAYKKSKLDNLAIGPYLVK